MSPVTPQPSAALPSMIAIDGPAASGKSTIGHALAQRLGYLYFDTGVVYRAVTWLALTRGTPISDEAAVAQLAAAEQIDVVAPAGEDDGRLATVLAGGHDVTWAVRQPLVDANVSVVAAYPKVSEALSWLAGRGVLRESHILHGIPHPSGANAERIAYFLGRKDKAALSSRTNGAQIDAARLALAEKMAALGLH